MIRDEALYLNNYKTVLHHPVHLLQVADLECRMEELKSEPL